MIKRVLSIKDLLILNPDTMGTVFKDENFKFSYIFYLFATTVISCMIYGFAIGIWHSPKNALYISIKFPLLIILTILGTSFINWILSILLGLNLKFKESLFLILISYSISGIILASFSTVVLFIILNLPGISAASMVSYSCFILINVILIAVSGIISNIKLYKFISSFVIRKKSAYILFIWLSINLFLGAQLSWNFRPFFGSPYGKITFLRKDAFRSNFYESVFKLTKNIILNRNRERININEQPKRTP